MLQRRTVHVIVAAVVLATSAGCLGPLSYRPERKKAAAPVQKASKDKLPPAPDAKANNATLAGIDTTGLGVRDDVHIWIFSSYSSPSRRAALVQLGKAVQAVLANAPKTPDDARKLQQPIGEALQKLQIVPGITRTQFQELETNLYHNTVNTPERSKVYLQYSLLMPPDVAKWETEPAPAVKPVAVAATPATATAPVANAAPAGSTPAGALAAAPAVAPAANAPAAAGPAQVATATPTAATATAEPPKAAAVEHPSATATAPAVTEAPADSPADHKGHEESAADSAKELEP